MRQFVNEGDVKNAVKKLFKKYGWFYWMPPGNGYGTSGVADFNALKGGRFLALETKFGSNKPTPAQTNYLRNVQVMGCLAMVVNEKTLVDLEEWLAMDDSLPNLPVFDALRIAS